MGRPISPQELTGRDGAPLIPETTTDLEVARRIAFALSKPLHGRGFIPERTAVEPEPSPAVAPPPPQVHPLPLADDDEGAAAARRWAEREEARRFDQRTTPTTQPNIVRIRPK